MTVSVRPWDQIAADLRDDATIPCDFADYNCQCATCQGLQREAAVAGDALAAEVARLHSWAGIMSLLDEHYPSEVFDGSSGDPGPTIVALTRQLSALAAVVAAVHAALDQWEYRLGGYAGCRECVADVAKAVGR